MVKIGKHVQANADREQIEQNGLNQALTRSGYGIAHSGKHTSSLSGGKTYFR
ncbi:hypothetical protein SDC9_195763 [bioreactor metagenome]|uniref:Uncharacterized protein n=1 Tax=bioreactor metagenome TaxID=1076179 RepID=A0A645IA75_9ZZZZ